MFHAITDACIIQGINVNSEKSSLWFWKIIDECHKNIPSDDIGTCGCFYHLSQATWRKNQNLGLTAFHKECNHIRMFCGIVDGLAFLPINSINTDINSLFKTMPNELFELLRFFDETYISGQNDSKGRKHHKCLRGIGYAICFS